MIRRIGLLLLITGLFSGVTWGQDTPADFIEASVDNPTPYVGQPVLFTWRWFLATANAGSTNDNTRIQLPDFAGFGQETLPVSDPQSQLVNGRQYQVITQQIVLYPLQVGAINIASIRISTPETPFAPAALLETQPIALNVQPLPPNAPESFQNGVGQFDISSAVSTTAVIAGQPVSFIVRLTGTGNITQVLAPALLLPDGWRVYPQPSRLEQSSSQVGTRIFEWTLIPLQAGAQSLPSIELSYFSPQAQSYQTVRTLPIALDVMPGAAPQATPILSSTPPVSTQTATLPLKTLPATLGTSQPRIDMSFWLLWLFPPFFVGGLWWLQRRQTTPTTSPRISGSRALTQAQTGLKSIVGMKPKAASEQIGAVIYGYVSAKAGKAVNADTLAEAINKLPADLRQRITACVEQTEAARYAPITVADVNLLLKETLAMLIQVDKVWK